MMKKEQPDYLAYLLRLWRVNGNGKFQSGTSKAVWRASLENPHTGERQGFASLETLVDFLREQTGVTAPSAAPHRSQSSLDRQKREERDSSQVVDKQKELKR